MTDRVRSLVVILDGDTRTDDAETIVSAIRMIRGVAQVDLGPCVDMSDHVARGVVRSELSQKIWEVLHPPSPEKKR